MTLTKAESDRNTDSTLAILPGNQVLLFVCVYLYLMGTYNHDYTVCYIQNASE